MGLKGLRLTGLCRFLGRRGRPLGQPAEFPRICGGRAGVPIVLKRAGGVIHAGVQATLADHTCGAAATTLLQAGQFVLTAEFNLHLLRAATGEKLVCHAQVLKAGRSLAFTEAEVFAISGEQQTLVSKLSATMSIQTFSP